VLSYPNSLVKQLKESFKRLQEKSFDTTQGRYDDLEGEFLTI